MSSIIFFLIFIPILSIILLSVNFIFAPHNPYKEKKTPFECGYHSFLSQNRTQFTISFFIFALLFLIFDLEIVLIYPYTVSSYANNVYGLIVMIVFTLIVTVGFIFELGKNALKIESKQTQYIEPKTNDTKTLKPLQSGLLFWFKTWNKNFLYNICIRIFVTVLIGISQKYFISLGFTNLDQKYFYYLYCIFWLVPMDVLTFGLKNQDYKFNLNKFIISSLMFVGLFTLTYLGYFSLIYANLFSLLANILSEGLDFSHWNLSFKDIVQKILKKLGEQIVSYIHRFVNAIKNLFKLVNSFENRDNKITMGGRASLAEKNESEKLKSITSLCMEQDTPKGSKGKEIRPASPEVKQVESVEQSISSKKRARPQSMEMLAGPSRINPAPESVSSVMPELASKATNPRLSEIYSLGLLDYKKQLALLDRCVKDLEINAQIKKLDAYINKRKVSSTIGLVIKEADKREAILKLLESQPDTKYGKSWIAWKNEKENINSFFNKQANSISFRDFIKDTAYKGLEIDTTLIVSSTKYTSQWSVFAVFEAYKNKFTQQQTELDSLSKQLENLLSKPEKDLNQILGIKSEIKSLIDSSIKDIIKSRGLAFDFLKSNLKVDFYSGFNHHIFLTGLNNKVGIYDREYLKNVVDIKKEIPKDIFKNS